LEFGGIFFSFFPSKGAFSAGIRRFGGFIIKELFKNGVEINFFINICPISVGIDFRRFTEEWYYPCFMGYYAVLRRKTVYYLHCEVSLADGGSGKSYRCQRHLLGTGQ